MIDATTILIPFGSPVDIGHAQTPHVHPVKISQKPFFVPTGVTALPPFGYSIIHVGGNYFRFKKN